MVKELLKIAKEDLPVYINHVREAFAKLADGERDDIVLAVRLISRAEDKLFNISIPAVDGCDKEETAFIEAYINAEVYNLLSALGGEHLTFYFDSGKEKLRSMLAALEETFGTDQTLSGRKGFGKCINVIDRMIAGMGSKAVRHTKGFCFRLKDISEMTGKLMEERQQKREQDIFHKAYKNLKGKVLCGIDIGGTDIKAVLALDGKLAYIKEYDWFPAVYRTADEIMEPIVDIVRLLAVKAAYDMLPETELKAPAFPELGIELEKAMDKNADGEFIRGISLKAEELMTGRLIDIDALGMCFPDVVVRDRIIGGETYKTRGIRNNAEVDYEVEFAKFLELNERLEKYARVVRNTNDGPMASFTAAVEWAASGKDADLRKGIFAHTLGTELGTGWVDGEGRIPELPLEVYNFIIDLGSYVQRGYEADDVRSINNFNTNLAGTLQKYASQSGAFRLAVRYFTEKRPDLLKEMEDKGFIKIKDTAHGKGIYVELEQKDMRKPFLEYLMALPDREYDPTVPDEDDVTRKLWMDIGEYMAVTWCETDRLLKPEVKSRILFGRLVKNKTCFELMKKGAGRIKQGIVFEAADETMSYSPLMKQLEESGDYTVAQFAQAVGAVYYGNAGLIAE